MYIIYFLVSNYSLLGGLLVRISTEGSQVGDGLSDLLGTVLEVRPTNIPGAITVTYAFSPKFSQFPPPPNLLHIHGSAPFYSVFAKYTLNDTCVVFAR